MIRNLSLLALSLACPILGTSAEWKKLTASDVRLEQGPYHSDFIDKLDKVGKGLPAKKARDVINDVNHITTPTMPNDIPNMIHSFSWEGSPQGGDGFDDRKTHAWYPQGVTSSWDAVENGKYDGMDVMLVSWHAHKISEDKNFEKRGARISFITYGDTERPRYRHVLLVQPTDYDKPTDNFSAIPHLHAGGIAWYGDHLYVMETTNGVRMFDLRKIYQVEDDKGSYDKIGKVGGKYHGYGYKYVLPQVRAYHPAAKNGISMRFSWAYIDRTTKPDSDSFLIGEWSDKKTDNLIVRFPLDGTKNDLAVGKDGYAEASEAFYHPYLQVQGGASVNGKYFFTQSWKPRGHLITWDGKVPPTVRNYSCALPLGPEDMSYKPGNGGLWTLSESIAEGRDLFAVDVDGFKGESQNYC